MQQNRLDCLVCGRKPASDQTALNNADCALSIYDFSFHKGVAGQIAAVNTTVLSSHTIVTLHVLIIIPHLNSGGVHCSKTSILNKTRSKLTFTNDNTGRGESLIVVIILAGESVCLIAVNTQIQCCHTHIMLTDAQVSLSSYCERTTWKELITCF